ncbi:MAG: ABC transporter substrate-binding protein [Trueperaceae bacterium]|nr:MAG: ABC transporter substrate-binding protein [Trueperaceae bacterium]
MKTPRTVKIHGLLKGAIAGLLLFSLLAFAVAQDGPPTLRPGKLIMAINATIPPVQFIDEQGNLVGMRVDLGEEIARRLGLEAEWVNIQFEAMIPGLQGDRWDMINTGLFYTGERAEIMELVPYELQAISISVPAGNPGTIDSTEDLAGMSIAVEVAGYEERNIREINDSQVANGLESMDIRTFNTFADAYQALRAGQVDATVSVDATAKFFQDRGDFERAISGLRGSPASLAFKDTELAQAVADVMNEMLEDGFYDELFDRWGVAKIQGWEMWNGQFEVF